MRLFRKSKPAQGPVVHIEEEQQLETANHRVEDQKPTLPPALQLNFELPSLPSSSLDFGSQTINDENASDDQPLLDQSSQHLKLPSTIAAHVQHPPSEAANAKPQMTLFEQLSQEQRKLSEYDYLPDIEDSSAQRPEDLVKKQLWEQFGNKQLSQQPPENTLQSNTGLSAPNLLQIQNQKRQPPQAMHRQIEQILAASASNRTQQPSKSTSSNDGSSSSEDDNTQKLSQSMAAMSLTNAKSQAESGMQISDRALHIQKMREASALGKLSIFNKSGVSVDIEDENDSVPLGGLRQIKNNGASNMHVSGAGILHPQQLSYNNMAHHGLNGQSLQEFAQASQSPRQAVFRQPQMAMLSPSSASAKPYAFVPLAGARETEQPCAAPYGVSRSNMSLQSLPTMHNAQASRQQVAYSRTAAIAGNSSQPIAMNNHMYRPPLSGASSVTYGNVGLSRGAVMQDPGKMYTPSPLGQMPLYYQSAINNGYMPPQMAAVSNAMHAATPQHQPISHHPQQQQQQPQSAALMSYIPSHDHCRGSMAKNPLMRDINKVKQFSARDYTSRPTLLAEADSRRMAKKNMPGLGGTTCHSFQPEPMPVSQPQLAPSDMYSPPQTPSHRNYPEYARDPQRHAHRSETSRRRPPSRQPYDDVGHGYMTSSSSISNKRQSMRREARPKRHGKYNDAYDRHIDRPSMNEFRHRERSGRSRSTLSRHLQKRRHHDQTYDYYEYDDDYPDSLGSDYYDEWEGDYDDCYEQERYSRRRSSRGSPRRRMSRLDGHRQHYSRKWDYEMRSGHRRHRSAHLDDPRDSNGIVLAATKQLNQQNMANASSFIAQAQSNRPRSQFGRILANMKRKTEASKPASPSLSAHQSLDTNEAAVKDNREEAEQPEAEQLDKANLSDDEQISPDRPPSSASNACSELPVHPASNSTCTTPVVPAATVAAVAAN
ncbi:hypothetical protein IWW36_000187 [Coemansia brasiliensis]|uniref:Uncharacterized protein n=1 Tax=Coemansia brasiliensis TaxID=2650707 RepID=A0A9W8M079_9FUNG|nr:hypothetical protein IWW36_000187 [Coemansia brasiliensis]